VKLVGIMPVRNEAWVLGCSARIALKWCDHLIVLAHACADGSIRLLQQIGEQILRERSDKVITIQFDDSPGWPEMQQRQRLLGGARSFGATHIALIDADEVLTADSLPRVRGAIEALRPGEALHVSMTCMWRSLVHYRVDRGLWANRRDLTLAFCDDPRLGWKLEGYDHHHRAPWGAKGGVDRPDLRVMHLQWVGWRRLVAKHARYKMLERIKYPAKPVAEIDTIYSLALDERNLKLDRAPEAWWRGYEAERALIDVDAEPWQESECKRLIDEHGADYFKGLDLFGVV
jgi:hypothetical protein